VKFQSTKKSVLTWFKPSFCLGLPSGND
jgi:hypothetical protein